MRTRHRAYDTFLTVRSNPESVASEPLQYALAAEAEMINAIEDCQRLAAPHGITIDPLPRTANLFQLLVRPSAARERIHDLLARNQEQGESLARNADKVRSHLAMKAPTSLPIYEFGLAASSFSDNSEASLDQMARVAADSGLPEKTCQEFINSLLQADSPTALLELVGRLDKSVQRHLLYDTDQSKPTDEAP